MKNYTGVRKEMKETGWNRRDRAGSQGKPKELWQRPGSDKYYTYESAVRRFRKDQNSQ